MKRLLSVVLAFLLMLGLASPALAATPKAVTMRVELVEGSVTIKDAGGVTLDYFEGIQLYSGYSVETGDDSCAYISLDDSKAIKLSMNTSVTIKKSGRKLQVKLKAGEIMFNVTTPLPGNESLEIRTSTMITGVRGSSGGVNAETGEIFYGTGHGIVWFRETDQTSSLYGLSQRTELWGGRIVSVNWPVKDMELSDFSALFLGEVAENPDLQNSLKMEGRFDPQDMINLLPLILEAEIAAREEAKSSAVPLPESATDSPVNGDNVNPAFNNNWDLPTIVTPPPIIDLDDFIIPDDPMNPDEPETTAYTVTWKNEDGTILETDKNVPVGTVPEFNGSDPIKPANAQYTYSFAGWDSIPAAVTGDAVYTATYKGTPKTYTITWKVNDETTTVNCDYGSVIVPPADPTKTGYTFAGWGSAVPETMPAENLSFTAQWDVNTYTITWKNDDGTLINTTTVAYGEVPTHAAPTKEADAQFTYSFAGWSPVPNSVTGEATYTATYTNNAKTFTIQWMNGGTVFRTDTYDFGIPVANPVTPEKTGYTFSGWDGEIPETMPAENLIFNAVWTVNKYTVTWMIDGESSPVDYEYGSDITPPADPTKTGYTFAGWGGTVPATMPAENLSFTAQWNINTYTITWIVDGVSSPVDCEYGSAVTPPADPTKTGYTFAGWGGTVPATMPAEDLSFTAQWNINKYTVTWLNYNNSELEKDEDVPYGEVPSYDDETPTKPENSEYTYVFKEWTPAVSSVSGDATYTATFTTRSKVTVTLTEGVESITIGEDTFTTTGNYDVLYNEALLVSYTLEDGYADGPTTALMVGDSAVSEGTNAKDGGTTEIPGGSEVKVANLYKHITALNDTQVTMNSIIDSDVSLPDGTFTLNFDLFVTENGELTIEESATLTLAAGHTITNNGTITIYGTLTNYGTITNEDAIIIEDGGELMNCSEDTLNNKGSIYLFGTLYNGSGSYQGKVINSAGAKLIGPGTFLSSDSSSLVNDGLLLYEGDGSFGITSGNGTLAIGGFCSEDSDELIWYLTEGEAVDTYDLSVVNLTPSVGIAIPDYDREGNEGVTPWRPYLESIVSLALSEGITGIGDNAFRGLYGPLESLVIPEDVTSIGNGAFYASGVTSVSILGNVTSIEEQAFAQCTSLTSINLPDSLTSIGEYAFDDCKKLESISVPSGVTALPNRVFADCTALTTVNLPDSITSIGFAAFEFCQSLTQIDLPDSLTSIGNAAFNGCYALKSITIPNGVTSIGESAFRHCDSLTAITIPNSVTSIEDNTFQYSGLVTVTIPSSVTSIKNDAFQGCDALTTVEILGSVTSIGNGAFDSCSKLKTINIPDTVTSIGTNAFFRCSELESITIPDSVTSIGVDAFQYCTSLERIYIPASVTSIGDTAFGDCENLTHAYFYHLTPPDVDFANVFSNCNVELTVYYPIESDAEDEWEACYDPVDTWNAYTK